MDSDFITAETSSTIFASLLQSIEEDEFKEETAEISRKIAEIQPPTAKPAKQRLLTVPPFDSSRNLLDPEPMRKFVENHFTPTENFTPVISTTNTMEGFLSNVNFHEEELIKKVRPDHDIVMYHCNYGEHVYPGYIPMTKNKKKTIVKNSNRKVQGSGKAFNSQLTAVVRSRSSTIGPESKIILPAAIAKYLRGRASLVDGVVVPAEPRPDPEEPMPGPDDYQLHWPGEIGDDPLESVVGLMTGRWKELYIDDHDFIHIPTATPVYKIKIFRTGCIQLPGVRPDIINDVMASVDVLVRMLNGVLHPGVTDPIKLVHLIYLLPVMKNYKFNTKPRVVKEITSDGRQVEKQYPLVDLGKLARLLEKYHSFVTPTINEYGAEVAPPKPDWGNDVPPAAPAIFDIKYSREDTKLSVKFSTPIPKKTRKKTRVNIFMSGKVNILGAFDDKATDQIVQYLDWVLRMNPDVFVETFVAKPWSVPRIDNIEAPEPADVERILFDQEHGIPAELPELTDAEVAAIFGLA